MLSSQSTASASTVAQANSEPSLTPLILFAASPGTITGVITLSAAHTRLKLPITALVAIVVAVMVTWLVMLFFARFTGKQDGGGFIRDTMTRLMGLIVLSMGVHLPSRDFTHSRPEIKPCSISFDPTLGNVNAKGIGLCKIYSMY
ncbi:MAG: MarC family protein [Candidatus Competibacteraceae bacterium]